MYDLLIYLLGNAKRILNSAETQIYLFKAMHVLEIPISSMKNDITDQIKEQSKEIFAEQESVLNNAKVLLTKRQEIIDQFTKNNIISRDKNVFDAPETITEGMPKKEEPDNLFKWIRVS